MAKRKTLVTPDPAFMTRLFNRFAEAASRPEVAPFGAAGPSPALMPVKSLNAILRGIVSRHPRQIFTYDAPPGLPLMRGQIARRSLSWGCKGKLPVEEIVSTNGTMEAINLALLAAFRPGDRIAVESPVYYGILQAVEAMGMQAVEIDTDPEHGMNPGALESALQKKKLRGAVIVSNYSNPLGSCIPTANKKRIVELLAARNLPLIEDDIYGDLSHPDESRPVVAKSFDRKGLVLLCGSVSKTLAPGYRIGWLAAGRYAERVRELKFAMSIGNCTVTQMAVAEFLARDLYDPHLARIRRLYAAQVARVREAVTAEFPAGTRLSRPRGGFLLWVELPPGVDSLKLLDRALRKNISLMPGPFFSPTRRHANCIRLSCGNPFDARFEKAVVTLGKLLRQG
ncbi:PLP-dependent aminotransferase family protein [Oscillatoria laete-virens NRMC-F 0139]|nr:PLP-dependent aminotransferase family protein [Oscillatoria laete-virens]MDL5055740.1 PLP-dependent aminotransferase family protein [Oscillatoria laete-virens NRMC-F 0139]